MTLADLPPAAEGTEGSNGAHGDGRTRDNEAVLLPDQIRLRIVHADEVHRAGAVLDE